MTHLGTLTQTDKELLAKKVQEVEDYISHEMWPINEAHLDGCVDYIVTKLILYKESEPFKNHVLPKYTNAN
jgi:hypothetical protein